MLGFQSHARARGQVIRMIVLGFKLLNVKSQLCSAKNYIIIKCYCQAIKDVSKKINFDEISYITYQLSCGIKFMQTLGILHRVNCFFCSSHYEFMS